MGLLATVADKSRRHENKRSVDSVGLLIRWKALFFPRPLSIDQVWAPSTIKRRPMNRYVGIDVSLEASSVCVVDGTGNIACESKIHIEPGALIAWLKGPK